MPSLTLPGRLIWFAHCPKAGGTSVEQVMVAQWGAAVRHLHWGWQRWWHRGGWRLADPPNSPQHLVWRDAQHLLPDPPDLVFALVRDPVARMESEYRWQRHHRQGTRLGRALSWLPFDLWLRLMLAMARRNPHVFDNHFRAQSEFIPPGAQVFHLEEGLQVVVDWLAEVTGAPLSQHPLPHAIATRGAGRARLASPASAGRIAQVYGEDYTRFGYHRPAPEALDRGPGLALEFAARPLVWAERRGWL